MFLWRRRLPLPDDSRQPTSGWTNLLLGLSWVGAYIVSFLLLSLYHFPYYSLWNHLAATVVVTPIVFLAWRWVYGCVADYFLIRRSVLPPLKGKMQRAMQRWRHGDPRSHE